MQKSKLNFPIFFILAPTDNPTSTNGTVVTLKSDANGITDDMLWYISYSDYGNIKIAPKARQTQNRVMAVYCDLTNQEQNGLAFIEQTYSDDAYDTDEWEVFSRDLEINLNVYIDNGYRVRYSEDYESRVAEIMQQTRNFYWNNFNVFVDYTFDFAFSSSADLCMDEDDNIYVCSCEEKGCSPHHRSIDAMLDSIPEPDLSQEAAILISGYETCKKTADANSNECEDAGVHGVASIGRAIAVVDNFSTERSILKTVIHEIGHWYGAEDHHGIGGELNSSDMEIKYPGRDYDDICIYGSKKENLQEMVACSGCKMQMQANIGRFQHD